MVLDSGSTAVEGKRGETANQRWGQILKEWLTLLKNADFFFFFWNEASLKRVIVPTGLGRVKRDRIQLRRVNQSLLEKDVQKIKV